jgi:hypothetical protein
MNSLTVTKCLYYKSIAQLNIICFVVLCTEHSRKFADLNEASVLYINAEQTPWPLVRKRTIPTERQPLVDEI